jgi:hypothetical protein
MAMRLRGIIAALLAGLLCLGTAASAIAEPGYGGPDPAVAAWPGWTGNVTCGGVPFDPLAAFGGPTNAERGTLPSEVVLRKWTIESRHTSVPVPLHGWRLLVETPHFAEFGHGRLSDRFGAETIEVERQRGGGWKWAGYAGGCRPSLLRRGQAAITWTLAPEQRLTPSTRTIKVNLGPGECASGRSQNERLEKPEFREENGALLMALWIHPVPPGFYTCVGLIEPPVTIRLPAALGERRLLDGGVFPPQPPVGEEG